jgi:hypothetical protein
MSHPNGLGEREWGGWKERERRERERERERERQEGGPEAEGRCDGSDESINPTTFCMSHE